MGTPGVPKLLSVPDLFQEVSRDTQPIVEREIACSGITSSVVILMRQPIALHSHADQDEMLYIVAGEATLVVGVREEKVGPGWYGLVPRGVAHSLTQRGRNAPYLLAVRTGKPCG
jgi:mannose-6-phosphate isomerase-like protein (cupin superfamily)